MNLYHGFPEFTVSPIAVRTCSLSQKNMQQSLLPGNRIAPAVGRFAGTLLSISLPQVSHLYNLRCHLLTFLKDCTRIVCISLFHYISDTRRRTRCILASISTLQVSSPSSVSSCKTKWAKYHVFFYLNSSHVYCVSMTKKL